MSRQGANSASLLAKFLIVLSVLAAPPAFAEASGARWSVSLGYLKLSPNDSSSEISGPGLPPGTGVAVGTSESVVTSVKFDQSDHISYQLFAAPWMDFNVAADGSIAGLGGIGKVEALFPTLMANYRFRRAGAMIRPFIGVGVNYTIFGNESANSTLSGALGGPTGVSLDNSVGFAAHIGFDASLGDRSYLSTGFAWIDVDTSATIATPAAGTTRTVDVDVDPSAFYLTAGYRF